MKELNDLSKSELLSMFLLLKDGFDNLLTNNLHQEIGEMEGANGLATIADMLDEYFINQHYRKILANLELNFDMSIDFKRDEVRKWFDFEPIDEHVYTGTNPRYLRDRNMRTADKFNKVWLSVGSSLNSDEDEQMEEILSELNFTNQAF